VSLRTGPTRVWRTTAALTVSVFAALLLGAAPASAATNWSVGLQSASHGQAKSNVAPSAPASTSTACTSGSSNTINVTWPSVARATNYAVYQATAVGGPYTLVATVATTSYTTGGLNAASYWYKTAALIGSNWASAQTAASTQRTVSVFLFVFWSCS